MFILIIGQTYIECTCNLTNIGKKHFYVRSSLSKSRCLISDVFLKLP